MGVPSLFRWISRKYPKCIYSVENQEVDNLYLDLNGIIHPCCHPSHKEAPETEEAMFREIYRTIDHLVEIVNPKQLLYIAVDGVAPRAKMNQQRERRFKSGEVTDAHIEGVGREKFDPNTITPGTPFMYRLQVSLIRYIEERISYGGEKWKQLAVIYSGCDVPGEGEHKVYDFIRTIKGKGVRHAICGLDADLIFLSLATHEVSFKVLREDVFWIEKQAKSFCSSCKVSGHSTGNCVGEEFPPYIYLDIEVLRNYLRNEFNPALRMKADFERMIDDWVFMCFFVGNDFLPCIPSMDIKVNAIETITESYVNGLIKRHRYLTDSTSIYIPELIHLMDTLGSSENHLLRAKLESYVRFTKKGNEKPREEDMEIKLFEKQGRSEYYRRKLHANNPEEIKNVCLEYIKGLHWILHYYQKGCPSWNWYYPFHFAPLAEDIAGALKTMKNVDFSFELGAPRRPLEQIMAVMPPTSSESIPKDLHKIFDILPENYPTEVKVDMFGKTMAWQGVVILPFLDYNRLISLVRDTVHLLPVEELYRNVEGKDILILPTGRPEYAAAESLYTEFSKPNGTRIVTKWFSGKAFMHLEGKLPGADGLLKEENKPYTTQSISVVFHPKEYATST
ncbi:5'-3' exoribonuclease 4 [Nematocida sp. LUAm3]|nr:5'-3' exoribonuclease 4 [Nematocida sp. LUAm3]KAI5175517.1 5'-3' exoribonuclease 4 [Nematocida sp. LUAm2]KAI5178453.1 5'-3' exoribonuclease 4 [Nematocida sp. LUAm1]